MMKRPSFLMSRSERAMPKELVLLFDPPTGVLMMLRVIHHHRDTTSKQLPKIPVLQQEPGELQRDAIAARFLRPVPQGHAECQPGRS